ncbi:MAG: hypothetical protein AB1424_08830 [Thermodesulfobacteriota bacterium]
MPKTNHRTKWPRFSLLILLLMLGMAWLVWAQPPGGARGGPGGGDDPGGGGGPGAGGPGRPARSRFDPRQAATIKGEVESLGSYGMSGWRVAPGMAVQGLVLKTEKGYAEIDLGPPGYVAEKGFKLKMGETLEVTGFRATRDDRTIFIAATVKSANQTLRLLDERGFPLWRSRGPGGPGPRGKESDGMGPGGPGRGRL